MSSELTWHSLGEPRGRGWPAEAMDRRYDRLPTHARDLVPELVWGLSRHSSSLFHEFETDATELHARWEIRGPEMELGHMPATATAGLDLYAQSSEGMLRWVRSEERRVGKGRRGATARGHEKGDGVCERGV